MAIIRPWDLLGPTTDQDSPGELPRSPPGPLRNAFLARFLWIFDRFSQDLGSILDCEIDPKSQTTTFLESAQNTAPASKNQGFVFPETLEKVPKTVEKACPKRQSRKASVLGPFRAPLGCSRGALGRLLATLEELLGALGWHLWRSWAPLGRSWGTLGHFWAVLDASGTLLEGLSSDLLVDLERFLVDFGRFFVISNAWGAHPILVDG